MFLPVKMFLMLCSKRNLKNFVTKKNFCVCSGRRRHKNKGRQSGGAEMPPPHFAPPHEPEARAPLLPSPPSGGPPAPALEVVYVGLGATRQNPLDILREKRVRVPEELQETVQGLNVTADQVKLAADNHGRMQARAHVVAREMGVLAPLGEDPLRSFCFDLIERMLLSALGGRWEEMLE
jgi:hypothetical protein